MKQTKHMTVGFIGYGNMAQAIAQGLVDNDVIEAENIVACAAHYDTLQERVKTIGAQALRDAHEVVRESNIVIIAIKPHQIESVIKPLAASLSGSRTLVVSIAAGWNLAQYQQLLGKDVHMQCAIPNTPISIGKGILVTEEANSLDAEQYDIFERLFSPIAQIETIDTAHMDIATTIAGCAPAFTDMYIEALADAAVKYGLPRTSAYRLAARMMEGSGALVLSSGMHPGALKDAVTSPGGTTIKGVAALEQRGFRGSVIAAIDTIEGAES